MRSANNVNKEDDKGLYSSAFEPLFHRREMSLQYMKALFKRLSLTVIKTS